MFLRHSGKEEINENRCQEMGKVERWRRGVGGDKNMKVLEGERLEKERSMDGRGNEMDIVKRRVKCGWV